MPRKTSGENRSFSQKQRKYQKLFVSFKGLSLEDLKMTIALNLMLRQAKTWLKVIRSVR